MKKSILYLISLLAMMFIAIPKISNAAPDNPCYTVVVTCPDGSKSAGVVCSDEDLSEFIKAFCKIEINVEVIK